MKISPEPLSPLDSWRELWQSKPSDSQAKANRTDSQSRDGKRTKRVSFHWLNHILNRDLTK